MFLNKVVDDAKLVQEIYQSSRFKRYVMFMAGLMILGVSFNLFILPSEMVFGVTGIAVMLNSLLGIDPSYLIFIFNMILLVASFVYLGKETTAYTIVGSILYPVFVALTSSLTIDLGNTEPVVIALTGAALAGIADGLIYRAGFTTGGTSVLKQIVAKYGKKSMGQATLYVESVIVLCGVFTFGWQSFIYSTIALITISTITDKVMLGSSRYKSFQIITNKEKEIRQFILRQFNRGVAVIDNKSDELGKNKYVVFCTVQTKEYFLLKEAIKRIDKDASFIVTDTYEVNGLN